MEKQEPLYRLVRYVLQYATIMAEVLWWAEVSALHRPPCSQASEWEIHRPTQPRTWIDVDLAWNTLLEGLSLCLSNNKKNSHFQHCATHLRLWQAKKTLLLTLTLHLKPTGWSLTPESLLAFVKCLLCVRHCSEVETPKRLVWCFPCLSSKTARGHYSVPWAIFIVDQCQSLSRSTVIESE